MRLFSKHYLCAFLTAAVLGTAAAVAQSDATSSSAAEVDSASMAALPTDLHAGFVIATSGPSIYSAYGHCAVHLTCPSHNLDYCFTFCMDATFEHYVQFFRGTALAQYACIPTEAFLRDYVEEGRTVVDHEINLSVDQVRTLWQLFDEECQRGPHFHFDFLRKNCSSMSLRAVERCLGGDQLTFGALPTAVSDTYRHFLREASAQRPWSYFVWGTLLGKVGEEKGTVEDKASPAYIIETLQHATFENVDGTSRPVLTGNTTTLVEGDHNWDRTAFPPMVALLVLTMAALLVTLLQWRGRAAMVVRLFDVLLLFAQTLAGIAMFYQSCLSGLDIMHRNWNLLVLNPLPAILWLCFHKQSWFRRVWMGCSVVILVYIALAAVTPQIGLLQILMALPLLVRTAANGFLTSKK